MDEQQVIDIVQRFFDTMMSKKSATDLPTITTTEGFNAIGVDATKRSVQVSMELLKGEAGDPLTVRKTYQTEVEALADKNPIDTTTSLPLTVGQFVSIVDDEEKNGIYRIGSIDGSGTMSLELQGKLGDLSDYANHGYESNPKTLKEVDDDLSEHKLDYVAHMEDYAKNVFKIKNRLPVNESYSINFTAESNNALYLNNDGKFTPTYVVPLDGKVVKGDKYYLAINLNINSEVNIERLRYSGVAYAIGLDTKNISLIAEIEENSDTAYLTSRRVVGQSGNMLIDSVYVINLTDAFGKNNEPSKSDFELMLQIIGKFAGERLLTQKELAQLSLELQGKLGDLSEYLKINDKKLDKLYNNKDKLFLDPKNIALKNYLIKGISMRTYYPNDPYPDTINTSEKGYIMVVPIDNDTTYTVTKYEGGNRFRVGLLMEYPTAESMPLAIHNTQWLADSADKQTTTITNTIGANYLGIYIALDADSIPNVQVEEGEFETDYEEPIPKTISIDDISNIEKSIPEITQFFGFSETKVISQKGITEKFDEISQSRHIFGVFRDDIVHSYYSNISESHIRIKSDGTISNTYVFEIENGRSYKVSKGGGGNRFRVSLFDDLPINEEDKIYVNQQFSSNDGNTEQTYVITNTSNSRYMMVMVGFNTNEVPSVEVVLIKSPLTFNNYEYNTDEAVRRFMNSVNEKARDIGMINSNFVNPHGGGKYGINTTTARDLFKMMVHGCSYEKLCNIWSKRKATQKVIGENARETEVKNSMFSQIEAQYLSMNGVVNPYWILGCKAGGWSTGENKTFANCVLVEINEMLIVIVVQTSDGSGTTGRISRVQGVVEMIGIVQAILDDTYTDDMQVTTVQKAIAGIVPKMPQSYKEYEDFEILYELNADVQFNPASCSKVIATMVALDTCDNLYETLKIRGDEIVNDSSYYAQEGDIETIQSSLYASMLSSNGTNTLAIARHCGGKMLYEEQKLLE